MVLAISEIFALGLVVVSLAPSQTAASIIAGVLMFVLLFLDGLWVQPVQVGEPLRSIMYFSPTGAAAKALLESAVSGTPSLTPIATMMVYTAMFGFVAIRYFRWE